MLSNFHFKLKKIDGIFFHTFLLKIINFNKCHNRHANMSINNLLPVNKTKCNSLKKLKSLIKTHFKKNAILKMDILNFIIVKGI